MDTKPSAGPWTVQERLSGSENHRGFLIRSANGFVIAEVYPIDQDGNEGRANAQRIAASLELLEALRKLDDAARLIRVEARMAIASAGAA